MYSKRLKELRFDNNILQKDLAKVLNIDETTYTNYETEYYIIPLKYLVIISNYFNVSLDYLLDFTNKKNDKIVFKEIDKIKSGERLKEFRKENKLTQDKLANYLNTNRSLLSNYEKGIYLISTSFLYMICKKYNVSADYLLGRIDTSKYLK